VGRVRARGPARRPPRDRDGGSAVVLLTWGEFLFGLSLTTDEAIQPLTVALAGFSASTGTPWSEVMAVATVVAIPIVLVFVLLQRFIVGGLTLGGIKE
jgi:multiple sugar transport system permease protein